MSARCKTGVFLQYLRSPTDHTHLLSDGAHVGFVEASNLTVLAEWEVVSLGQICTRWSLLALITHSVIKSTFCNILLNTCRSSYHISSMIPILVLRSLRRYIYIQNRSRSAFGPLQGAISRNSARTYNPSPETQQASRFSNIELSTIHFAVSAGVCLWRRPAT